MMTTCQLGPCGKSLVTFESKYKYVQWRKSIENFVCKIWHFVPTKLFAAISGHMYDPHCWGLVVGVDAEVGEVRRWQQQKLESPPMHGHGPVSCIWYRIRQSGDILIYPLDVCSWEGPHDDTTALIFSTISLWHVCFLSASRDPVERR